MNAHYEQLLIQIENAKQKYGLKQSVKLLAVSKKATVEQIRELYHQGQKDFGENYWQQAKHKLEALKDLHITWHFIGQLQNNKLKDIARHFAWVHSVTRIDQLELLSKYREELSTLNILLQVNLSDDKLKNGVTPAELASLIKAAQALPNIKLQGLMVLPKPGSTSDFTKLAAIRDSYKQMCSVELPELSMGMSQDYPEAMRAGATWIRIGSALFE